MIKISPRHSITWSEQSIPLPERSILSVRNVYSTVYGVTFKNLRIFIPSLAGEWVKDLFAYTFLLKQWYGQHIVLPSSEDGIALFYDQWSENYYHWIIDCLPRLLVLREKFPNYLLLLPKSAAPFMEKTVSIMGFNRYFFIEKGQILKAHKVVIPQHTAPSLFHDPELIRKVRQELINGLGESKNKATRRLYVSRSMQNKRRIINEQDISDILLKYNFETIHFESLSFEDQVALMQEAEIVIGIHGANMTNILFMQPKCQVIEFLNKKSINPLYFRLSSYLDLSYYALLCEHVVEGSVSKDVGIMPGANDYNLLVDAVKLGSTLDTIFNK